MIDEINTEIEQGMRNAKQGNIGRQLGVTKVFDIKNRMNAVKKNMIHSMYSMTQIGQGAEYKEEISEYKKAVSNVENLEKELELLEEDKKDNNQDVEMRENQKLLDVTIVKAEKQLEQNLKKKADQAKALAQKKQIAATKQESQQEEAPLQPPGFDWEQISENIEI